MQESTAEEGDVIIREGESGDIFYVLEEGKIVDYIYKIYPTLIQTNNRKMRSVDQ